MLPEKSLSGVLPLPPFRQNWKRRHGGQLNFPIEKKRLKCVLPKKVFLLRGKPCPDTLSSNDQITETPPQETAIFGGGFHTFGLLQSRNFWLSMKSFLGLLLGWADLAATYRPPNRPYRPNCVFVILWRTFFFPNINFRSIWPSISKNVFLWVFQTRKDHSHIFFTLFDHSIMKKCFDD